ncbi:MAG: FG-GAP-like repeat-containing protein [Thermoleophilia bacterium]
MKRITGKNTSLMIVPAMVLAMALLLALGGGTALAAADDDPAAAEGGADSSATMVAVTAADSLDGSLEPEAAAETPVDAALEPEAAPAEDAGTAPAETEESELPTTAQIVPDSPQASDFNNDGNSELAILYNYGNSNTGLWLFNPNGSGYAAPQNVWTSGIGNWDWNRAKVTTSDYNGDGASELAVLYDYGNATTGLWLFDPTPSGYAAPRNVWSSGTGNWDWNRSRLTTSDYNGDNLTELAVLYDYGNSTTGLWLFDPSGSGYSAPRSVWSSGRGNWDATRSKLTASDYNGDGETEMAILYDYGNSTTTLWMMDPSASGYSAPRSTWSSGSGNWSWPRSKLVMSDFNGDGRSELAVLYNYDNANTGLWLFDPSGSGYSAPRSVWSSGRGNWDWFRSRLVGSDFNGDGNTEIGIFYNYDNANTGLWLLDPNGSGYGAPRNVWSSGRGNWDWARTKVPQGTNFKTRSWTTGVEWIDINLSNQTLYAMGRKVFEVEERYYIYTTGAVFSTLIASGAAATPTPTGNFHVYGMNKYTDMRGPGYYAPDVPFVLWFYGDYSIHGTYWHNSFGAPRSHGCVNLPTPAAEWLFYRAHIGMPVRVHY